MRPGTILSTSLLAVCLFTLPAFAQQDVISTLIGGGPNNIPALNADLYSPVAVTFDSSGNLYIAANAQNRVFKMDTTGTLTVLAGQGIAGYGGDGVPGGASNALLNSPSGVAVDSSGNVYIADFNNSVIRVVDTTNTISTVAGMQGSCGFNGDGSPATNKKLCNPAGMALDSAGNLYFADSGNCRIRKLVLSANAISTMAGSSTCGYAGDGGPATAAELNGSVGVTLDAASNLYIADTMNFRIRMVNQGTGTISTVAGTGVKGYTGDGGPAVGARIGLVYQGVWANAAGTKVFISDYSNYRVRQFTVGGAIATVAGVGYPLFCGDGKSALSACLNHPQGLTQSASGTVTLADTDNYRIRQFTVGGTISTIAGDGSASQATPVNGVPANGVTLNYPFSALEDPSSNIFVADQNNSMVRELLQATDQVNLFAGDGTAGFLGDGGPATLAELDNTFGVARDMSGNIYIADAYNNVIRQVNPSGIISTYAGTPGVCGYTGDGGTPNAATLCDPQGVFVDSQNNVYIADTGNNVVRLVSAGVISTFAGNGLAGFSGDGGPANQAELNLPNSVAEDGSGNIYIADTQNCRVREVAAGTTVITTVAGNGVCGFSGDGTATLNALYYPTGVAADVNGNLFIADTSNNRLRWVNPTGSMVTFAGNGTAGFGGDGKQATVAELAGPTSVSQDSFGNFLVADQYNLRLRGITAFAGINTNSNNVNFGPEAQGLPSGTQTIKPSGVGPATISSITVSGDFTQTNNCGQSLPNGKTCTVHISFKPRTAGTRKGLLTINSNGYFSGATKVNLSGTGGYMAVQGSPVAFGTLSVGSASAPKTVKLTNTSTSAITMGDITLNETTDFLIYSSTCPPAGSTLASQASCTLQLEFKPQTAGLKTGTAAVNDNDISSPQSLILTGTGQ